MQVHDEIRKCTAFLGFPTELRGFKPIGTGFFINIEQDGFDFGYLVTAAHLVRNVATPISVRVNAKEGVPFVDAIPQDDWIFHPNNKMDICVLPSTVNPLDDNDPHDILFVGIQSIALRGQKLDESGLTIGDEVFIPSLFANLTGELRNIPILRTAHIAAMPEEPIWPPSPKPAYLVETRSLGGASGSPVFLGGARGRTLGKPQPARRYALTDGKTGKTRRVTLLPYSFVGMILGAHSGPYGDDFYGAEEIPPDALFNAGISIAMTATDILDFLEGPILKAKRDEEIAAQTNARGYRPSSVGRVRVGKSSAPKVKDENPQHREDFTSLLNAAAKKPPQVD